MSKGKTTGIAEGACCYCGKQIEQPAEYGIHLLSDLEDPQVDLCVECGSKETPTCEQIWKRNAERLRALEAEGRPYKLEGEPGYTECSGYDGACGGCDRCLRLQDEHYSGKSSEPFELIPIHGEPGEPSE